MATASYCHLAGQVCNEFELWDAATAARCKRPLEEILTLLRKGSLLLKHGRQGKPKVHYFRLAASDTILKWKSASGSVRQVKLRTVTELVPGQTTDVFKRHMLRETSFSFSLKYTDDDGSHRTLDLTCADQQQYEAWYTGLRVVADRLRVTGTPAVAAAAAYAAATPLTARGSGSSFSTPTAADLTNCYGGGTAVGRASGAMGIPVVEHIPGDVLVWGAASRSAQAVSTRSGLPEQEVWQRSKVPLPLACNAALDVRCAAVGRLHGILSTSSGAVYTWGEGKGGKLGLGHDQDQATPHKLEAGLRGQCVVAVAAGDDCTAAITDSGVLYMWGRLAGLPRPQLVPVPVRGELNNRIISKVSCGPFHCAAVSADGALFTWGEGFGGKLGHGDQGSRGEPTLVQALYDRQVLGVTCGVWHTAAIVLELEGPLGLAVRAAAANSPIKDQAGGELLGLDAGAVLSVAHHRRNSSASSAFSDASFFHEGQGGTLYTWGGVNEPCVYGANEKRDSNKGCLGHGELDVYTGQLLPMRVGGALEGKSVRHVAAGLHLTVAVTTGGRVFQMGATGASGGKFCPWEGALQPEQVKGALSGYFVDSVTCGMHHVLALARPLERRLGRPSEHAPTLVFAWGRGSEGQLGTGKHDDSATPLVVDGLKGRTVLQVAAGGSNVLVVCEHDAKRFEPETREVAEEAATALYSMMDAKPPKQLRIQIPEGYASGALTTSRARTISQQQPNANALVPYAQPGPLSRPGSAPKPHGGSGGRPPTISEMYATLRTAQRQQHVAGQQQSRRRLPGSRGDGGAPQQLSGSGSGPGSSSSGQPPRVLSVPLGSARRHHISVSASMPSLSGASHAPSWGAASELSSLSSMRQPSEDWSVGGDSHHAGVPGLDLAAIDEAGSITSLNEELYEKNRMIQHLESKLQQLRRQTSRASDGEADERLRQSVRFSAGQFRESFQAADLASAGGSGSVRGSRGPPSLSRPSMTISEAGTSVFGGDEDREASLKAMEQMLVRKQVHLESQQHKLAQWAMELQRREIELQRQQAEAEGRPFTAPNMPSAASAPAGLLAAGPMSPPGLDGVPPPIASDSPLIMQRHNQRGSNDFGAAASLAAARTAPAGLPLADFAAPPAGPAGSEYPPRTPAGHGRPPEAFAMGTPMPGTANPDAGTVAEWMEEIEMGVFVTYTIENGARKLKRIRFSRTVFSKDSAAKWYEANKHRLAQPMESPARAAAEREQQQQAGDGGLAGQAPQFGRSRLGSRNLSFDPSELGSLQQPLPAAASTGPLPSKPSRLSQVSRRCDTAPPAMCAAVPEWQAGGEGEVLAQQQQQQEEEEQQEQQQVCQQGGAAGAEAEAQPRGAPSPAVLRSFPVAMSPDSSPQPSPAQSPAKLEPAQAQQQQPGAAEGAGEDYDSDSSGPDPEPFASPFAAEPEPQQQAGWQGQAGTAGCSVGDGSPTSSDAGGSGSVGAVANGLLPPGGLLSPGSRQLSQLPSEVMSLSQLPSSLLDAGSVGAFGGGSGGGGSGRSSPSKRSSSLHHFSPAAKASSSLQHQGSGTGRLVRDLSRASFSSARSDVSRGSGRSGQFSPRFAAADPKPSPRAAAITALTSVQAASKADGPQRTVTSSSDASLSSQSGSGGGSGSRLSRIARAFSSRKKDKDKPSREGSNH